jgi:acetoin utilization deacetylase AcuC-like enzyme
LKDIAGELCEGRIAFFLEGGYNLHALADVVGCAIARFHGQDLATKFDEVADIDGFGTDMVKQALDIQKKYWQL